MSEIKHGDAQEIFSREIIMEPLLQLFVEKFEKLAPICRDRADASNVCMYHDSAPTDCRFGICPRLDIPLDVAADYLKKTEERRA